MKDHICAACLRNPAVVIKIPGIGLKVFPCAKLGGVDKNADHGNIVISGRTQNQGFVAVVQKAHGRYKPDLLALLAAAAGISLHLSYARYHFHCGNTPFRTSSIYRRMLLSMALFKSA